MHLVCLLLSFLFSVWHFMGGLYKLCSLRRPMIESQGDNRLTSQPKKFSFLDMTSLHHKLNLWPYAKSHHPSETICSHWLAEICLTLVWKRFESWDTADWCYRSSKAYRSIIPEPLHCVAASHTIGRGFHLPVSGNWVCYWIQTDDYQLLLS